MALATGRFSPAYAVCYLFFEMDPLYWLHPCSITDTDTQSGFVTLLPIAYISRQISSIDDHTSFSISLLLRPQFTDPPLFYIRH